MNKEEADRMKERPVKEKPGATEKAIS